MLNALSGEHKSNKQLALSAHVTCFVFLCLPTSYDNSTQKLHIPAGRRSFHIFPAYVLTVRHIPAMQQFTKYFPAMRQYTKYSPAMPPKDAADPASRRT